MMHLHALFTSPQPGEHQILSGRRAVSRCFASLAALCLEDSISLVIAGSDARQPGAASAYANVISVLRKPCLALR
jgi:hypothetical protein